ncbi:MAG: nucleotidyltransferase domain-containing protein [Gammaproteobacteria bacterium]|nr:nucleotidyltransferase domain-containing protein [Gammaproteobacteria bacterium]
MTAHHTIPLNALQQVLAQHEGLNFAVLVGSRAQGTARPESDWDIALSWALGIDWLERIARSETLRRALAHALGVAEDRIDLIDLDRANLAMRAAVAEEGCPLWGEDHPAWARFLRRTWRELEDFYWEREHAA